MRRNAQLSLSASWARRASGWLWLVVSVFIGSQSGSVTARSRADGSCVAIRE